MDTAALAFVGMLRGASPAQLAALAAASHRSRLARGQVLFVEGEPSRDLYVVVSGRLKVVLRSAQGVELVLNLLDPGDVIGELSVLDGQPRSAGVEAVDSSELLVVPSAAVRELLAGSIELTTNLALDLAAVVRRQTGSTADLVFLDLPRRLAKLLVSTAGDRPAVDLGLSQAEIAARLGSGRQAVNRALAALGQRGWIRVDGSVIHLLDRARLEAFANS